jgi:lysozyme family protein
VIIRNEGDYVNHTVAGDRGGQTFAVLPVNFIAIGKAVFYKEKFWDKLKCDDIPNQRVATTLFDFAVNAGVRTAAKLAQLTIGATPDGIIGSKSVAKLSDVDPELFATKYALAKVARYTEIVKKDRS